MSNAHAHLADASALLDRLGRSWPEAVAILGRAAELAREQGAALYLVGGVVRDLLLERPSVDLDLVVEGDGIELGRRLAVELGGSLRVHETFLTAELTLPAGLRLDVASARRECYAQPAVLPRVEPASLDEDLARRDFSINAMAIPLGGPGAAMLIDPYRGREALRAGHLCVLHERSFLDDPTRLARAVRFEARLGLRLDPRAEELAVGAARSGTLDHLSGARLLQELLLILADPSHAAAALRRLSDLGVAAAFHPALAWRASDAARLAAIYQATEELQAGVEEPARVALAGWLADRSQASRSGVADRLGLSGSLRAWVLEAPERIAAAASLVASRSLRPHEASRALRLLSGPELVLMVARGPGAAASWARRELTEMRQLRLEIRGADLLALGFPPGEPIGRALEAVRDARLDGVIEAGDELAMARRLLATAAAQAERAKAGRPGALATGSRA